MRRGPSRREQDPPCPPRPSDRAQERLRAAVNRDVADLRLQLEEASLRSDAFLWAGYPEAAAEVVDEKRELVSRFESRLRQRLSEAAVEAEAERILAATPGAAALSDEPADPAADRRSPALLSALAAALLALVAVNGPVTSLGEPSSSEGGAPATGEHEIVALPDEHQAGHTPTHAHRSPVVPEPEIPRTQAGTLRSADRVPDASPTERFVGMIQGLVDAADSAVRDALRALLAETQVPALPPSSDAPDAEPVADRPAEPEDETPGETTDGGAYEAEEPADESSDGEGLATVTEPLDPRGEDGEGDEAGDDPSAER